MTPGSAVRHASVARYVTDCATRPGNLTNVNKILRHCLSSGWHDSTCMERTNKNRCPVIIIMQRRRLNVAPTMYMPATSVCETCFLVRQVNSIWWDTEASSNLYPVSTLKRATGVSLAGREWSDIACIILSRK